MAQLWLGYEWLHAGWEKVTSPAWMDGGKALKGFATGAIASSKDPEHPQVAYGWWVSFLHWVSDNASWMAKLIAVVVYLVMGMLLAGQMMMRLALVDVLLIIAPVALVCWVVPQTYGWARLWTQAFSARCSCSSN